MKWWDVRKLATPIETLMLDVTKGEEQLLSKALGASALEYEPTIPTRFTVRSIKIYVDSLLYIHMGNILIIHTC